MMSEKQIGAVFKFNPEDIKPFMDGKIPEDEFPWMKYGSRLASMASNSVGKQLIDRLKEVDRPCEVRVVVSVGLDFSIHPEGTVLNEVDR
jgi:hypothetical protein